MVSQRRGVMQIMWHITNKCNIRCKHCYTQGRDAVDLSTEDMIGIANNIRGLHDVYQVSRVGLLGGEPFMRSDFFTLARHLLDSGIPRVDVATNGTLLTDAIIKEIKQSGISSVQVSIEGPSEETNDSIRGKGTFHMVETLLQKLHDAGISTVLLVTVSKQNYDYLADIIAFAARMKVEIVSFNRFLPIGRGKDEMGSQCLSPDQLHKMITYIHDVNSKNNGIFVTSDDPLLHGLHPRGAVVKGGCGAGIGNLAIMEDGMVYPCRRMPIPIGNATVSSLLDIMQNNHFIKLLRHRDKLKGECQSCKYRNTCGGCRASAYAFKNDPMESDPMCPLIHEGGCHA